MFATELARKFDGLKLEEQVIAMALPVILARVQRLAKPDLDALMDVVKEIPNATSTEDLEEILATMREIIEQRPGSAVALDLTGNAPQPGNLTKWLDFVSRKLREARSEAGLTQQQLSEQSGLPQSHLSRIETGKLSPSHRTLERVAKALGMPVTIFDPCA